MKSAVVVLAGGALLLASAALAQDASTLQAVHDGRDLYVVHCARCHGIDARGNGWSTDGTDVPNLTLISVRDGSFKPVHVGNHINGRHDAESVTRTMPLWVRHLREEWPNGDAMAQQKVCWLAQYLASVQQTTTPNR